MKSASPRRRAFTFVEIIVVVLILAILAAIVVPKVMAYQDEAKDAALRHATRLQV